jgi:hypothetical protein
LLRNKGAVSFQGKRIWVKLAFRSCERHSSFLR